jgi:ATP/maltotriose-dependent transcriptional regulator MalT
MRGGRREIIAPMQIPGYVIAWGQRLVMMSNFLRQSATWLLLCTALAARAEAAAQGCDARPQQSQFVQANFQRIAIEGDLASAQDFADRARRGLDQLASEARRCGCEAAQTRFEAAAAQMRLARSAESRKALREVTQQAVTQFDAAMAEQRKCGGL